MISNRRTPLDAVKDALRWTRRTVTGALHPWRRERARSRLRTAPPPGTILVICYGNICRSPYAAGALRRLLPGAASAIRVESAGFAGPHRPSPREAIDVAAAHGVDLRRHTSRLASPATIAGADLVIVMEPGQVSRLATIAKTKGTVLVLGDLDPDPVAQRTIRDPVEQPRQVFAATYERIDRCLAELVNAIWGPSRP